MVIVLVTYPEAGPNIGRKYSSTCVLQFETKYLDSQRITGWAGQIRVDGQTYTWMGAIPNTVLATQVSAMYTSTKSIFTLDVGGKVTMTVTFMSPVTPHDLKRQSLIASYLDVGVASADGASHKVELYSDISAGKCINTLGDHHRLNRT